MTVPARGEIWWWEAANVGRRPVVVISRDATIVARRRCIVAPCTTTIRNLPTEVQLDADTEPVPVDCVANLDAIDDVSIAVLVDRIGRLSDVTMTRLCAALAVAVDCP